MQKTLSLKSRMNKNLYNNVEGFINFFRDNRHIYMQKNEHPFWKSYQTFPPVPYTLRKFARLCHFLNFVPKDNTKPFIIDYEHVLMMSGKSRDYVYMINSISKIQSQLKSKKCRAIFVPSQGAIRETSRYIDISNIRDKIHIVRPIYPQQPENQHNYNGPFTILTIGNKFWGKGMPIAIEAFRILRERYGTDIRMQLVSGDVPSNYPLPKGVNLLNVLMMTDRLRSKIYKEAHVFIFPCLHDSYAVYQEAMAYGVPIITTRIYDKDELVLDGQTGYLIDTPISMYDGPFGIEWKSWDEFQEIVKRKFKRGDFSEMIDEIVAKTELLINDINLVRNMGAASQKLQREKFSPEMRNEQVRRIYNQIIEQL